MSEQERVVIAARRAVGKTPAKIKLTIELDADDVALVRLVARDWGLTLGGAVAATMRCFVASGWSGRDELTVSKVGVQRIRDAVARWEATKGQPVLDAGVHTGPAPSR
jgi:hypothetical protein